MKSQPWGRKTPPASTHRPRRLPHSPRPRLYFRPVVHTSPACPSAAPTKTSASRRMTFVPAAATFTLPPRRSHFSRIAFRGPRRAIGIPQQQLSTMGYPRKSYPHRCPPPCAKRSRPRACARVYIIYRSPVGRSRGVSAPLRKRVRAVVPPCPAPPCAGWGRAKAKADAPSRSAEPCRLCAESLCAKAEVHKANPAPVRAFFPRQPAYGHALARLCAESLCAKAEVHKAIPAPARAFFPRQLVYDRALCPLMGVAPCVLPASARLRPRPRPLVCRITVRNGGSAQGNPRSCPCVLPAPACLRPRPRPLMGEVPCAGWGRAKAKADAPSHSNPPQPVRSPCGSLSTAAPPPPKWAPRLRRREGKRPNGAPPHRTAHTSNAERKRYLHNSRTKTQRRTKRCAQFVIFVFTPCKLLHNFSTVLHRSPREVPKRAQMAARRPDFPCFTARFSPLSPESHCAKHPRPAPVLPPKNAPLRAYAKPRSHPRVRGTRQHATTCAFFTFSARYERICGPPKTNFCPAEGRKWGRLRSKMLKNGLQTKKSTFSFGRLVI